MALFDRFWRGSRSGAPDGAGTPAEFFPLYESTRPLDDDDDDDPRPRVSGVPDYDAWDAKLAGIDDALVIEEKRRRR